MHSLPIFVRLEGRPVILLGDGDAADAKRRLLDRAGARICDGSAEAALAVVAIEENEAAEAAVARLKARGILVNAVDRPALCDFTLPAIVDRDPVLVAIGTGGASAGLAKALRQRLEALLPASLGRLADALQAARPAISARWPDAAPRRRAIDVALDGPLDPFDENGPDAVSAWLSGADDALVNERRTVILLSPDPDDLTLRTARALAKADRVYHDGHVPTAILDRARADASRIAGLPADDVEEPGLTLILKMAA